jgi:transcriptional regulator with XRE-family HTH domain
LEAPAVPAADLINPDASMWHWLAYDLRRYRLARKASAAEVATIMRCSRPQVSNYEAMKRRPELDQMKRLDEAWRTSGHFARIFRYARGNHDPNWFVEHLHYEQRARAIRLFEPLIVPGLLQTPDYARVAISTEGSTDVERDVKARMTRQAILTRTRLIVLLDECVIDRPVGGPSIMREQLVRLLEISQFPNVIIQIAPRRVGFHLGMAGAFKIMECEPEGDVAYTEASEGGRLALDHADVQKFVVRFEEIGADSLPRSESREMIQRAMENMT